MGSFVAHLLIAALSTTSMISGARNDESTIRFEERPPLTGGTSLPFPSWIPHVDHYGVPNTKQCSSEKTGTQPSVVININNFFCITETQEVTLDPIKTQIFNIAFGNQELNTPREYDMGGTQVRTTQRIFEHSPKHGGTQHDEFKKCECCEDSRNSDHRGKLNEYLNGRNGRPKHEWDTLIRRFFETQQPPAFKDKTNHDDCYQLKDIICCKGGLDSALPKTNPMENRSLNWPLPSKNQGSNHEFTPNLQLFIGGQKINGSKSHQNIRTHTPSSDNFNEALDALFQESSYSEFGKKTTLCKPEEGPTCSNDAVIFGGGFELTFEQLQQIVEEIKNKPEYIKLIVPGGISGPLLDYFQRIETTNHDLALQHGVCLLSNGFLVPIKPMVSLVRLYGWLSGLNSNLNSTTFRLLHVSMWNGMKGVLGILQCLIKSGQVKVGLPSNSKILFSQFEHQDHHLPGVLLEEMKVELFGFSIPYVIFKDGLLKLCQSLSSSPNT